MKKQFIKYSSALVVFFATAIVLQSYFIIAKVPHILRGKDATGQFIYFKYMIRELYQDGVLFWSWTYGLGGDIFGQFSYYYTTAITFLLSLFIKTETLTDVLELNLPTIIIQLTFAMFFVFALLQFKKRTWLASIIGGLLYGATSFFASYSAGFDFMIESFVLLPLLILAFEYYIEKDRAWVFIITLSLVIFSNFYFAYITTLYLMIYAIYKFFDCEKYTKNFVSFIKYVGVLSLYYIISLGIAAIGFLPAIYQFLNSDRVAMTYDIPIIHRVEVYERLLRWFFLAYQEEGAIGMPMIAFVILLAAFFIPKKDLLPKKILLVVVVSLMLIPYVYSVMNGFSAMQLRWFYMVLFTCSYLAGYFFDEIIQLPPKKLALLSVVSIGLIALSGSTSWNARDGFMIPYDKLLLLVGALSMLLLVFYARSIGTRWQAIIASCIIAVIAVNGVIQTTAYYRFISGPEKEQKQIMDNFLNQLSFENDNTKAIASRIKRNTTTLERTIWDDPLIIFNTGMYHGFYGNMAYNSLIPKNLHQFFKENAQTLSYGTVSVYDHYDQRLYLETLMGNKFQVIKQRARHIPYGHTPMDNNEDWILYGNDYTLPIGLWFNKQQWLTTSEANRLNSAQLDQSMMGNIIVHDDDKALQKSASVWQKNDLQTQALVRGLADASYYKIKPLTKDVFKVSGSEDDRGYIRVPIRKPNEKGEVHVSLDIVNHDPDELFKIKMLDKEMVYLGAKNKWNYPREHYTFNLGWELKEPYIDIYLTEGTYTIKNVDVHFNSYEPYAQQVANLQKNALHNLAITPHTLSGDTVTDKPGNMFFAVPYSRGWRAYIDGKEVPTHEVNYAFIGLEVPAGKHHIKLHYRTPFFNEGAMITLASILVLIIMESVKYYRRKKRYANVE